MILSSGDEINGIWNNDHIKNANFIKGFFKKKY
jgi:hypothetical protein